MTRVLRRGCGFAFAIFLLADLARADDELARQHFKQGVELYDRKQYAAALEEFRAAYREKPSAGIKQNIALCLKGLGKPVDAAIALDEALDEGTNLKPETRTAITRELDELSKQIATVHLRVLDQERHPIESATILVDGVALAPGAQRKPIRTMPGIHVFAARVEGYPSPPEKKLALVEGSPVDAVFEVSRSEGRVTIRPSVAGAVVRVDGVEVGRGVWSGKAAHGVHKIEVTAPGYQTAVVDLAVIGGGAVDYPVELRPPTDAPPAYAAPAKPPVLPSNMTKKAYVVFMGSIGVQTLRLAPALGEPIDGTKRSFGGVSAGLRGGVRTSRFLAIELLGELGVMGAEYSRSPTDLLDSKVSLVSWQLTPMLRFNSPGKVRFSTGVGFGIHGNTIDAKIANGTNVTSKRGASISTSFALDFGVQFDTGPVFFEPALFFDVNGLATVRDEDFPHDRLLLASPGVRGGVRLGLGIPFL